MLRARQSESQNQLAHIDAYPHANLDFVLCVRTLVAIRDSVMASNRSVAALAAVRERVARHISVPVSDAEALKIGFTCATVESDALLELSHSRVVRAEASAHTHTLAVSPNEMDALLSDDGFTNTRRFALTTELAGDEADPERQRQMDGIKRALKLTLMEKAQRELWDSNPRVRARVALAILRKDCHVQCLKHALGEVLASDLRLVEDLRCTTEDSGIDIMNVAALVSTVCSQIAS